MKHFAFRISHFTIIGYCSLFIANSLEIVNCKLLIGAGGD